MKSSPRTPFLIARALVLSVPLLLAASGARAATITVNSTADTTGGAPCTLRNAITAALSVSTFSRARKSIAHFPEPNASDASQSSGSSLTIEAP